MTITQRPNKYAREQYLRYNGIRRCDDLEPPQALFHPSLDSLSEYILRLPSRGAKLSRLT